MMNGNEVTYKRELNHSYMAIGCEESNLSGNFACQMLLHNRIGKLLDVSLRNLDGMTVLYYDISSRQPLERLYETRKLGMEQLAQIIHGIAAIREDLDEYLLDEQGLMLERGMIFADVETEELFFCYYPGRNRDNRPYAALADFFLEQVDHGEEHAVNTAYQFYKMSKTEYFVLSSFLPFLEKELTQWKKEQGRQNLSWEELPSELQGRGSNGQQSGETGGQQRGETNGRLYGQNAVLIDEAETEETAEEAQHSWLYRLFHRRKQERSAAEAAAGNAVNRFAQTETVWDSYEAQLNLAGSRETVYLADLEQTEPVQEGSWKLQEVNGPRQFVLENFPVTVGKLKGKVSIVLSDASVSRIHARFEKTISGNGILIRDLNAKNGTMVNGQRLAVNEAAELKDGDLLRFGRESFRLIFTPFYS